MHAGLFGVLPAVGRHRNRFKDNHCRTASGYLPVENQLSVGHTTVGIAGADLDGGKYEPIQKRQMAQGKSVKHPFHARPPL
jgi:hypothetical protein